MRQRSDCASAERTVVTPVQNDDSRLSTQSCEGQRLCGTPHLRPERATRRNSIHAGRWRCGGWHLAYRVACPLAADDPDLVEKRGHRGRSEHLELISAVRLALQDLMLVSPPCYQAEPQLQLLDVGLRP